MGELDKSNVNAEIVEVVQSALPLRRMNYDAKVDGLEAQMSLDLQYSNKLDHPIEAIFNFPLPREATVLDVVMKIGDKEIRSQLKSKSNAREEYNKAVDAGHHASLVEEERPNIFTMSVGGIEPNQEISVKVDYIHPVDWQNSGGRLTIPLVVAPRFIPGVALDKSQAGGWAADTDEVPDASRITPRVVENVDYVVSGSVRLAPGFEAQLNCPSHELVIESRNIAEGETICIPFDNLSPDRDLILAYETKAVLPSIKVDRSMKLIAGEDSPEEFVMVQLVPGLATKPKATEVVLLLDISGSMIGPSLDGLKVVAKKLVKEILAYQGDAPLKIGIATFDDRVRVLKELSRETSLADCEKIIGEIVSYSQGTEMGKALDKAMSMFSTVAAAGVERSIVLISDAQTEAMNFTAKKDVRVHSVGISSAINDAGLAHVAKRTGGALYWVRPGEDYDRAARQILSFISGPAVRDLKINGLPADSIVAGLQDLYAAKPVSLAIRSKSLLKNCTVQGVDGEGKAVTWNIPQVGGETSNLGAYLWTKMRLRDIDDRSEREKLSLRYGVLSPETAFIGISLKEIPGAKPEKIEIPVLLPQGWDFGAVFGQAGRGMHCLGTRSSMRTMGAPAMHGYDQVFDMDEITFGDVSSLHALDSDIDYADELLGSADTSYRVAKAAIVDNSLLESVKGILQELESGLPSKDIEQRFKDFVQELKKETSNNFAKFSDREKAELFLNLVKLRAYDGYKLDIPQVLRAKPVDPGAFAAYTSAQRELGISVQI